MVTELPTNCSFLRGGITWEEVWDRSVAPGLVFWESCVKSPSEVLPRWLCQMVDDHRLMLEEKSLVSEGARDNL